PPRTSAQGRKTSSKARLRGVRRTRAVLLAAFDPSSWRKETIIRPEMDERHVFDCTEGPELGRELLGGKGVGLAEMTGIGIPVPAGFTVTTAACIAYMRAGRQMPEGLEEEVAEHMERLEETAGKRFGAPADPLLVSVRS